MSIYFTMFIAGLLTITLPCILPLVPIVLGVSISGRSKWRPLLTIGGMLLSFVGFTFALTLLLHKYIAATDYIRIATYYILFLFGVGFITSKRPPLLVAALLGSLFFIEHGWMTVGIAAVLGMFATEIAGKIATTLQQFGTNVQHAAQNDFGQENPITAFIIGATMGFVWVPCAGPALGYVYTLIAAEPGLRALMLLLIYGAGVGLPLLLIGYGGQAAIKSVRKLSQYSGHIKKVAGVILIITAISLQFHFLRALETYLINQTPFGMIGIDLEMKLFGG